MEYKAYSFDLDDNLLKLPTKVFVKDKNNKIKKLSTLKFEKVRTSLDEFGLRLFNDSFNSFRDDKQFLIDIKNSETAGSWKNLVNCMIVHSSIFAIITARGHNPEALKKGLKWAILKYISKSELKKFKNNFSKKYKLITKGKSTSEILDIYLNLCKFYPTSNKQIQKRFKSTDISELKFLAFEDFKKYVKRHVWKNFGKDIKVKIGFSDDSIAHLNKMVNSILKKHGLFFYQTDKGKKNNFL
jgi:hypothetical protein